MPARIAAQLPKVASQAKDILGADHLDAVADSGYFNSLACEQADITVTLPETFAIGRKVGSGPFRQAGFRLSARLRMSIAARRAGSLLIVIRDEEDGKTMRRYWTTACPRCPLKSHVAGESSAA